MDRAWDSVSRFVRRQAIFVGGAAGTLLLLLGVLTDTTTATGTVLIGVGGSILAATALALISVGRDDLLEILLRQGVESVFDSRRRQCTDDFWESLIRGSSHHYRVLGVANHAYLGTHPKRARFSELFRAALMRGVSVELLWLSPDTRLGEQREEEENRSTRADITESILWFWALREDLPSDDVKNRLSLREYKLIPSCGLTWADGRLVVTHYVVGQENLDSPGWVLSTTPYPFYRRLLATIHLVADRPNALAKAYLDTYQEVWARATTITPNRVEALHKKLEGFQVVGKPSEAELREQKNAQEGVRSDAAE